MKNLPTCTVKIHENTNERLKFLKSRLTVKSSVDVINFLLDLEATQGATEKLEAIRATQELIARNHALVMELLTRSTGTKYIDPSSYLK